MFGLFKPRMAPEGPVEIEMDCAIARAASDVYPMVDFADPNHHKRAVGTITRTGDTTFELVVDMAPGLVFPITELEAAPPRVNTIESVLPPELGAPLIKTVERTKIEPLDEGSCTVTVKTTAYFRPMTMKQYEEELRRIAIACNNSLMKLKVHAEQGVDAVRAIEARQNA